MDTGDQLPPVLAEPWRTPYDLLRLLDLWAGCPC